MIPVLFIALYFKSLDLCILSTFINIPKLNPLQSHFGPSRVLNLYTQLDSLLILINSFGDFFLEHILSMTMCLLILFVDDLSINVNC